MEIGVCKFRARDTVSRVDSQLHLSLSGGSATWDVDCCKNGAVLGSQCLSFQLLDAHGNQVSCSIGQIYLLLVLMLSRSIDYPLWPEVKKLCRLTAGITT